MNAPLNDGPALARAAPDALRRGDARAARDLFMQAAQAGQADVAVMLGLAYSCRSLQDWAGVSAAIDRVLALKSLEDTESEKDQHRTENHRLVDSLDTRHVITPEQ